MPALRPHLAGLAAFGLGFIAVSVVVVLGGLHQLDRSVAYGVATLYTPALQIPFQAIAVLGGIELTTLTALGLFLYLWRRAERQAAFVVAVLPIATVVEILYKRLTVQSGPPANLNHPDGPSLSLFFEHGAGFGSTFPSGHVLRTVLVYGLVAFVVARLAQRALIRRLALAGVLALALLMSFDRLYLEVHWESDVIGGLLLGATFLVAAMTWLDWTAARG